MRFILYLVLLCKTKKTEKKESNQSTKLGPKQKPKQLTKTHAIPSIENFQEFKQWLLKKMAQLESLGLNDTGGETDY